MCCVCATVDLSSRDKTAIFVSAKDMDGVNELKTIENKITVSKESLILVAASNHEYNENYLMTNLCNVYLNRKSLSLFGVNSILVGILAYFPNYYLYLFFPLASMSSKPLRAILFASRAKKYE